MDGRIVEERTELTIPTRVTRHVIGEVPGINDPDAYYFDSDGRPARPDTEARLHQQLNDLLLLLDGRRRPQIPPRPSSDNAADWNRYLKRRGQGRVGSDRSDAPVPRRKRRNYAAVAPSEWTRIIIRRLAVHFDRPATDPLVIRMAATLSRDRDWHTWSGDIELLPLIQQIKERPIWTDPLIREVERIAFMRSREAWLKKEQQVLRMCYRLGGRQMVFRFPRDTHARIRKGALRSSALVWALVSGRLSRNADRRALAAAAVWKAGEFLEQPVRLAQRRPTLRVVTQEFCVTSHKVRSAATKLQKEANRLLSL